MIPWIAAFCATPEEETRLIILAEGLKQEFGHVLKPKEPVAWHKAAAGVIKHLNDNNVGLTEKDERSEDLSGDTVHRAGTDDGVPINSPG